MKTLEKIIAKYMYRITIVLVLLIMIIVLFVEVIGEQSREHQLTNDTFEVIEQILEENQKELEHIREGYMETCLHNAETIAKIIEGAPDIVDDVEELRRVAELVEVDEIHIIDSSGRIYAGTHPEYYGLTFDSGEQISFFKTMLKDKSLKLVQDIMPNTGQGKSMQYSACWGSNGEFIVQVGMEPVSVHKYTEKNELSHIFSHFVVDGVAVFYVVDKNSGDIVASSNMAHVGESLSELGLNFSKIQKDPDGFHAVVDGELSFCIFEKMGDNYVGRIVSARELYDSIPLTVLVLFVCLTVVAFVLAYTVTKHMDKYVVDAIYQVNAKLDAITNGNLEEKVDIESSVEMFALSEYINRMVKSMVDSNKRMSYVLSKTDLYIGIYEYNERRNKVKYTEYIPRIFSVEPEVMERLSMDVLGFKVFLEKLKENPEAGEPGVYKCGDRYIRCEEIVNGNDVFGVAIDLTANIVKLKEAKSERDIDSLTGLYNRRGFDLKMSQLFEKPEELGNAAIIMIDADNLKIINDTYGHDKGDIYLKKIAAIINNFGIKASVASRFGGDEFVLFLYEYDGKEELIKTIETLTYIQNNSSAKLSEDIVVPLKFSLGYNFVSEGIDYQQMIKKADEEMYKNKVERRKQSKASQ